jgi:hypothetical protein
LNYRKGGADLRSHIISSFLVLPLLVTVSTATPAFGQTPALANDTGIYYASGWGMRGSGHVFTIGKKLKGPASKNNEARKSSNFCGRTAIRGGKTIAALVIGIVLIILLAVLIRPRTGT